MDETPNLGLPYIMAAQSQKHVTHNEAIRALDAIVQLSVLDRDLTAPPGSPAEGARYIVAASPTGAWSGHAGDVAAFNIAIIEATSDLVCAYKPNVAFYEALGPERGYAALRKPLAAVPSHVITLADAKRGDVEHTARAYVKALYDNLGFDAATVNPYLGLDSVEP